MILSTPIGNYRWIENWVTVPEHYNRRTHGLAVTRNGQVLLFNQSDHAMLICSPDGKIEKSWGHYLGAHGLTLVEEEGQEFLWLVDERSASVQKTTLEGEIVQEIQRAPHPGYVPGLLYSPTQVAVNEKRHGGNGDIWVSDGYGLETVHRYKADGTYISSLDGKASGLRFQVPHGISFITINGQRQLWVADRSNCMVQVFDEEGNFIRRFGQDYFTSLNGFTPAENWIVVPELKGRVTVIDYDGNLICHIGENKAILNDPGWPNNPTGGLKAGLFNTPHYAAIDKSGNIYICEWFVGGRVTKLEKL